MELPEKAMVIFLTVGDFCHRIFTSAHLVLTHDSSRHESDLWRKK
jgi:hypothetical protein